MWRSSIHRAQSIQSIYRSRFFHIQATKHGLEALIKKEPVLVFSKTYCPYCSRVKALFEDLEVNHTVIELDERSEGSKIQEVLMELTSQRTVPNVFIHGNHIGGCDTVLGLHSKNKLLSLVNQQ